MIEDRDLTSHKFQVVSRRKEKRKSRANKFKEEDGTSYCRLFQVGFRWRRPPQAKATKMLTSLMTVLLALVVGCYSVSLVCAINPQKLPSPNERTTELGRPFGSSQQVPKLEQTNLTDHFDYLHKASGSAAHYKITNQTLDSVLRSCYLEAAGEGGNNLTVGTSGQGQSESQSQRDSLEEEEEKSVQFFVLKKRAASPEVDAASTILGLIGERLEIPCANLSALWSPPESAVQSQTGSRSRSQQPATSSQKQRANQMANIRQPFIANGSMGGISLIVWYKDEQLNSPIFTIDARRVMPNSSLRAAKQQTGADWLKGRAHLDEQPVGQIISRRLLLSEPSGSLSPSIQTHTSLPSLVIDEAGGRDAGLYTCTVEFHKEPTQTHQMRVHLVDPPRSLIIRDDTIEKPLGSLSASWLAIAGPYDEDSRQSVSCEIQEPGDPPAQVSWWQLRSVSAPASGKPEVARSSSLPLAADFADQQLEAGESLEYLTTVFYEPDDHEMKRVAAQDSGGRDYFIAFNSFNASHLASNSKSTISNNQSNNNRRPNNNNEAQFLMAANPMIHKASASNRQRGRSSNFRFRYWTRVRGQTSGLLRAAMEFQSLSRANQNDEYLCLARNNNFAPPLNKTLLLNLNLKPNEVKIISKTNQLFKLGLKVTIECHVYGSRPEAKVRWFRGSQELDSGNNHRSLDASEKSDPIDALVIGEQRDDLFNSHNNSVIISEFNRDTDKNINSSNLTILATSRTKVSYLTFIPQLSDNQQKITCSGSNPEMPNIPPLSDSITMNVLFPAQMSLLFGAGIKSDSIKLGSDVFMDCNINSNPPIDDLTWLFDGKPLAENPSAGILMSNLSLVIQRIKIEDRGHYQCMAQNSMGKFYSNKLELKPKFEPICDYSTTKSRYELHINQPVRVECNVLAEPEDDISFTWKYNQTSLNGLQNDSQIGHHSETLKQFETNFTRSFIMFTLKSRRHQGQLLCSASNSMGKQEKPCVIQVVASELPEPVFGCFTDSITNNSFSVHCQSPVAETGSQSSPPNGPSSSRVNYLLELYTNESINQDFSGASSSNQPQAMTHLRQRQELSRNQLISSGSTGIMYDDQALGVDREQQVKKITSDGPDFVVSDLKPDTSYHLAIYALNSKGRSAPVFDQASTLPGVIGSPEDPSASLDPQNGRIQFNRRLASQEAPMNLSEKLMSFLRLSDYLDSGDSLRPLLAVALVVLLCTLTVVMLSFFVIRLRRSATGSTHRRAKRNSTEGDKKGKSSGSSSPSSLIGGKLRTYDKREPQLDPNVQLTLATPSQLKGLAGSGSDTSRETNTDSTLVSMFRRNEVLVDGSATVDQSQQEQQCRGSSMRRLNGQGSLSATTTSLSTADRHSSLANGNHDHLYHGTNNNMTISPMLLSSSSSPPQSSQLQPHSQQQQPIEQYKINGLYSATMRRSLLNSPNNDTPQVSIQSGSDCTSTNNELQQQEPLPMDYFQQQADQKLLMKCQQTELEQPVYVIGQRSASTSGSYQPQSAPRQVRLIDGTSFWAAPGTFTAEANVEEANRMPAAECQQLAAEVTGSELPLPISLLSNSVSLPGPSTATVGDYFQQHNLYHSNNHNHHHLSQQPAQCQPGASILNNHKQQQQQHHHHRHLHEHQRRLSYDFLPAPSFEQHDLCCEGARLGLAADQTLRFQPSAVSNYGTNIHQHSSLRSSPAFGYATNFGGVQSLRRHTQQQQLAADSLAQLAADFGSMVGHRPPAAANVGLFPQQQAVGSNVVDVDSHQRKLKPSLKSSSNRQQGDRQLGQQANCQETALDSINDLNLSAE